MNVKDLKAYIKTHKIKYQEISDKSGIPVGTLRNIFSSSGIDPRYTTIEKIENALGINGGGTLAQEYFSAEEQKIIKTYRSLSERDKKIVVGILKNMSDNK